MRWMRYLSAVGLLLFIGILSTVDVGKTAEIILNADPAYLVMGLSFVTLEVLVRSLSWMVLVGTYSPIGYWNAFRAYMIGVAFGAVTPGKAGDFVKVTRIRDDTGLSLTKAFTVGLLDRIINFMFLFIGAAAASAALAFTLAGGAGSILALAVPAAAVVCALAVALNQRLSMTILRPLHAFLIPERFRRNTRELFSTFHETVGEFRDSNRKWTVMALTLTGWVIIFTRPYFFGQAIGLEVEWWMFIMFVPIISVAEVLPLSVMGLGTRDATILFLFGLMGVGREHMIALSAMLLLLSLAPVALAGYLIAWNQKIGDDEGFAG